MSVKVIVVGAGIGGLATTLALRRAGLDVVVLERATRSEKSDDLSRHGAGLTIWPNGVAILERLGVRENLPPISVPLRAVEFRTSEGKLIYRDRQGEFEARYGSPSMPFHRADLHQGLMRTVDPDTVTFGVSVTGYRREHGRAIATCQDGQEMAADVLVGADGISSAIRRQLVGDGEPEYAGMTSWRGVAPAAPDGMEPGEGGNTWGKGEEFGWMPIIDGRVYWYATHTVPLSQVNGSGDPDIEKREVLERFGGWHSPVRALIEVTPTSTLIRNGMFWRQPVDVWGDGPVTLLGDAAHAMQPHLAQGGCQAMEDAIALADCLATDRARPETGLRRYEERRTKAANWYITQSNRMGSTIHLRNPLACAVRNRAMAAFFKRADMKRHDRILLGGVLSEPLAA